MNWFYSPDGIQRHEVDDEALAELAREGRLTGDMLLWREGLAEWRPARELRADLFTPAAAAGPPPPPPPPETPVFAPAAAGPALPVYQPVPPQRPANAGALTSVISGSIGVATAITNFCCCAGIVVTPIAGLVAVIFGHMTYSAAKEHPEAEKDKNMALIGLILGYLSLLITAGYVLYLVLVVGIAGIGVMAEGLKNGSFPP